MPKILWTEEENLLIKSTYERGSQIVGLRYLVLRINKKRELENRPLIKDTNVRAKITQLTGKPYDPRHYETKFRK